MAKEDPVEIYPPPPPPVYGGSGRADRVGWADRVGRAGRAGGSGGPNFACIFVMLEFVCYNRKFQFCMNFV